MTVAEEGERDGDGEEEGMNEGEDVVGSAFLVFRFPLKLEGSLRQWRSFLWS